MEAYEQLEHEFAQWIGYPPERVVAVASGTAALHVALEALQLPKNSEVIVPEFTMIACARAVTMAGLKPVFVDCGNDLLMDCTKLRDVITKRTRAIMPVHIYGRQCAMRSIRDFAKLHRLKVVEDLAEAHGIPPKRESDAACWSFYKNKIVCGEEGGIIAFKKERAAGVARRLRCLGFDTRNNFLHMPRGVNARLSNSHAELVLHSLRNVEDNLKRRSEIEELYNCYIPPGWHMPKRDVVWVYDLCLPEDTDSQRVVGTLQQKQISARLGFKPMSQQPEYRQSYSRLNAYRISRRIIYLPVHPSMTNVVVSNIATELSGCVPFPAVDSRSGQRSARGVLQRSTP